MPSRKGSGNVEIIRPLCKKIGLSETLSHLTATGGNNATGKVEDLYQVLDAKYFSDKEYIYEAGSLPFMVYVVVQGAVELIRPETESNTKDLRKLQSSKKLSEEFSMGSLLEVRATSGHSKADPRKKRVETLSCW